MTVESPKINPIELIGEDEDRPEDVLTASYGAELFEKSFRFSQGSATLQRYIFEYIHALHPNWKMNSELKDLIHKIVAPNILKFVKSAELIAHPEIDKKPGYVEEHTQERLSSMQYALAFVGSVDRKGLIGDIGNGEIKQDYSFICQPNVITGKLGRPRKPGLNNTSPLGDPWFSFVGYYALDGNSTGIPDFDSMFAEVRDLINQNPDLKTNPQSPLSYVLSTYQTSGLGKMSLDSTSLDQ